MTSLRERILLYAGLTSLTALSIDGLLPALRRIGTDMAAAPPLSTQSVIALFVLGMAIGELFLGPLSDAVGRRKALLLGLGVYVVGTLVALQSASLPVLVLGRILQGIGVAGPKIATRAMIRDQFEGDAMARILSLMFTLFILVPMLAPLLAQGLTALAGWRAIFAAYLAIALLLGLWVFRRQPETLPPERRIPFRPKTLLANALRILASRRVTLLIGATGLVFGAQLLYLATAADLFFDVYGIAETFPAYFALLALGVGLASFINARCVRRFGMEAMARAGYAGLIAAGLALLAASALWSGKPPLALFLGLAFPAFFAIGILFGNLNAMAMRPLGHMAGLGASLIASGSSLVSALFATLFGRFYDGTLFTLATALATAGIAAVLLTEWAGHGGAAAIEPVRPAEGSAERGHGHPRPPRA
ncbi:multidrug effflux MFS transporter [Rhizobium sp. DKSPLA3]|uniref:Multidrug effflux MFS transporter n=1 Tax=Rhizobium quercicola TaxID=2901226 RepID=A0A9X1NSH7_9HYPH|nr:multidrug effflux MFS transporter [Rhizobium quercicola]MCD7110295.1 multidrug effflux MFS transporter [Rhizobium quercicola]